ncbi:MAG: septum formation inhibitor Maf [Lentisphaerae bacterium]|nr:septum formation inhibitor Maf [Lentisphaerota bacterium]
MAESKLGRRQLVLASASPRRCEYLRLLGYSFELAAPATEERQRPGEGAVDYVVRNAREKAQAVAAEKPDNAVVIAADTVVVLEGRILEKPKSAEDARDMLMALSGRTHQVISGFCVKGPAQDFSPRERAAAAVTDVVFKELSDQEIAAYVASGEPMDKAGAYAIQGRAAYMVRRIEGSYSNVVGLPLTELVETLEREFGIHPTFRNSVSG